MKASSELWSAGCPALESRHNKGELANLENGAASQPEKNEEKGKEFRETLTSSDISLLMHLVKVTSHIIVIFRHSSSHASVILLRHNFVTHFLASFSSHKGTSHSRQTCRHTSYRHNLATLVISRHTSSSDESPTPGSRLART